MCDDTFLQQRILSAIAQGVHTFQEIANTCGGLYPLELRSQLEELVKQQKVLQTAHSYRLLDNKEPHSAANSLEYHIKENYDAELPEPHPHDYDWRFDTATAQHLTAIALRESPPEGAILLLGAPSIFIELVYSQKAPNTVLLDWSSVLIKRIEQYHLPKSFRSVQHNLLSGQLWTGCDSVDVVVIDPPWYPEYYAAFLAQAAFLTRIGARILLSLLPTNTRPGAVADRWHIFETAQKLGLHLSSIHNGAIRYKTPIFEQASLHNASIEIGENWRQGDLVIFDKVDHPNSEVIDEILRDAVSLVEDRQEWAEILIGQKKIKLRGPFKNYREKPELLSIEPADTLPTVSRRYKGRESIDLWLWNNRVFAVRGKAAFLAALYKIAEKTIPQYLHWVPTRHLKLALALLIYKTEIMDFQTSKVWKEVQLDQTSYLVSKRSHRDTGT